MTEHRIPKIIDPQHGLPADANGQVFMALALTVALDRCGGTIDTTEAEYNAIVGRYLQIDRGVQIHLHDGVLTATLGARKPGLG